MKGLTPKQQRIWDMQASGMKSKDIALELGISYVVVSKQLQTCRRKLGLIGHKVPPRNVVENTDPEKFAAVVDGLSEPELKIRKLTETLRECGVPKNASEALIRRIRVKFFDAVTEVRNLKTNEILDLLGKKIHLALSYMDDKPMAEANFRDLAMGVTQMIEKRQLLRGEPTQIISEVDRKKLNELLPLMVEESRRRALTIDVTPKVVSDAEPARH